MGNVVLWTSEEDARLAALVAAGRTITETVADMPGRTEDGVQWRCRRLGLRFQRKRHAPRWPAYMDDLLRHYWNVEGLSASECGRRLGISRNAVIGRAHRLGLDARESPIIRREPVFALPHKHCEWLDGTGPYTSCMADPAPGKPYCAAHCKTAYRKERQYSDESREKLRERGMANVRKKRISSAVFAPGRLLGGSLE
jgi:GcrA cell cycle regulator